MGIQRPFRWLSDLGTTPEQSTSERRRITLTNQCALLSAATFTLSILVFPLARLWWGHFVAWPLLVVNGGGALSEALVLWVNARGFAILARYLMIVGASACIVCLAFLLGAHTVFLFYYFPLVLSPFLLFEDRRRFHRGALATLCFAGFAVLRWGLPERAWLPLPVSTLFVTLFEIGTLILVTFLMAMVALFFAGETERAEAKAALAFARSEELLLNILPASISARLKTEGRSLADGHAEVTVLFADIVGFTELSARLPPEEVVRMLNEVFSRFDDLSLQFGLEKIKTIGDAYMVAGGLPEPRGDHVEAVARMGLAMHRAIADLNLEHGRELELRIGMHTGPVVAGVIGKRKFIYDLWGDTVNTASRMESSGAPGAIQITREVRDRLEGKFRTERRGTIQVKGKGEMETFFLRGEA
jgi:class 3 adenylate cyclase